MEIIYCMDALWSQLNVELYLYWTEAQAQWSAAALLMLHDTLRKM